MSFLLLGVENIGVQIEQPFSVLPLELFCAIIRANVMEQLQAWTRVCTSLCVSAHCLTAETRVVTDNLTS